MPSVASWLLLMHQIPPKPDSLRMRVWRALQKIGAMQLKNSVYVLPTSKANREKLESLLREITSSKGDAFLCEAQFIQGIENREIVDQFNVDRSKRYKDLAKELRELQKLVDRKSPSENELMAVEHSIGKLARQFQELSEIDFFRCKDQAPTLKLLSALQAKTDSLRSGISAHVEKKEASQFQGRTWVTRSDVHVDRLACSWLILKFIDRRATLKFVGEGHYKPKKNEVRFDMFEAEFTHIGDKCSFEVLVESFSITDKAIRAIAEIIHDLDLRDTKFNRPETAGIGLVIQGIVKSERSDEARIAKASSLFDDLCESLKSV
jgi:hypothetical protein